MLRLARGSNDDVDPRGELVRRRGRRRRSHASYLDWPNNSSTPTTDTWGWTHADKSRPYRGSTCACSYRQHPVAAARTCRRESCLEPRAGIKCLGASSSFPIRFLCPARIEPSAATCVKTISGGKVAERIPRTSWYGTRTVANELFYAGGAPPHRVLPARSCVACVVCPFYCARLESLVCPRGDTRCAMATNTACTLTTPARASHRRSEAEAQSSTALLVVVSYSTRCTLLSPNTVRTVPYSTHWGERKEEEEEGEGMGQTHVWTRLRYRIPYVSKPAHGWERLQAHATD